MLKLKNALLFLSISIVALFGSIELCHPDSEITQITNNPVDDLYPQINNNGYVVWSHGERGSTVISLYDGIQTIRMSSNYPSDVNPRINDNGYVVWKAWTFFDGDFLGFGQIILYDGAETIQISNESSSNQGPQINNKNQVVWEGWGDISGVFLYDGTNTTKIANNSGGESPQINDNGYVVWHYYDGNDYEIFLYTPVSASGSGGGGGGG